MSETDHWNARAKAIREAEHWNQLRDWIRRLFPEIGIAANGERERCTAPTRSVSFPLCDRCTSEVLIEAGEIVAAWSDR